MDVEEVPAALGKEVRERNSGKGALSAAGRPDAVGVVGRALHVRDAVAVDHDVLTRFGQVGSARRSAGRRLAPGATRVAGLEAVPGHGAVGREANEHAPAQEGCLVRADSVALTVAVGELVGVGGGAVVN